MGKRVCFLGGLVLLGAWTTAFASPVDLETAKTAVGNWVRRPERTLNAALGTRVKTARSHRDTDGRTSYHVVQLEGGGFVVTAANDDLDIDTPIIAFSEDDDLVESADNPLFVMLNHDMGREAGSLNDRTQKTSAARGGPSGGVTRLRKAWDVLLSGEMTNAEKAGAGKSSPADVRVSPLVSSRWGQSTVGSKRVFNYYTPNHYVCGCVATAFAQIMRYHRQPTGSLPAMVFPIEVGNASTKKSTLAGAFDWNRMPLKPGSSISDSECRAIGMLTYNVGLSAEMSYSSGGSAAFLGTAAMALEDVYGYSSAKYVSSSSDITKYMEDFVLPNLDAGYPVAFGIFGSGGHCVVGDGYGYSVSSLYVHLNLGWDGSCDAWYCLPSVSAGGYNFNSLRQVAFNIFPNAKGEIVSGRVFSSGSAVSGAKVVAKNASDQIVASDTTDAKGIYALIVPSAGGVGSTVSYRIEASGSGGSGSSTVSVGRSVSGQEPGNRWGRDLVLSASFVVKFRGNGGSGSMDDQSVSVTGGAALSSNRFNRPGYVFLGWSRSSSATSATFEDKQHVTGSDFGASSGSSITLYAVWQAEKAVVTLKSLGIFGATSLTGGAVSSYSCQASYSDGTAKAVEPHWEVSSGGDVASISLSGELKTEVVSSTQAVAIKATYGGKSVTKTVTVNPVPLKKFDVVYDPGTYGSGSRLTVQKEEGRTLLLREALFTRTDYTQDGWSLQHDGSTKDFSLSAEYKTDGAVTLYPHWAANLVGLTISGKSRVGSNGKYDYSCWATYADNPNVNTLVNASWAVVSGSGASFTASYLNDYGCLRTPSFSSDSVITIQASFGGLSVVKDVTVVGTSTKMDIWSERWPSWSGPFVVTSTPGDSAIGIPGDYVGSTLFVEGEELYAHYNTTYRDRYVNDTSHATGFHINLYVDDELRVSKQEWVSDESGSFAYGEGEPLGCLSAGRHVLKLVMDGGNEVEESDESNNTYVLEVAVVPASGFYGISYEPGVYGTGKRRTTAMRKKGAPQRLQGSMFGRSGYSQGGWSRNPDGSTRDFAFNEVYAGPDSLVLYPYWTTTPSKYTVSFRPGDAGYGSSCIQPITEGMKLELGTRYASFFSRTGYEMVGWSLNSDGSTRDYELGERICVVKDMTLYPCWTKDGPQGWFHVIYAPGRYSEGQAVWDYSCAAIYHLHDEKFSRTRYVQTGWSKSPEGERMDYDLGAQYAECETMILYPHWTREENTHQVTYDFGDYGIGDRMLSVKEDGSALILRGESFKREGYRQVGWSLRPDGSTLDYELGGCYAPDESVRLYPHWAPEIVLQFAPGGGGTGQSSALKTASGILQKLPGAQFSRKGFVQTGWCVENADGTTSLYGLGASYTGDSQAVFTPSWSPAGYRIEYSLGSGTPGATHPSRATFGTAFCVSPPKRAGFAFVGWRVSRFDSQTAKWGKTSEPTDPVMSSSVTYGNGPSGNVYFQDLVSEAEGLVVLSAQWTPLYSIRFFLNDGAGAYAASDFPYGVSTRLPTVATLGFARRGFVFGGWATSIANAKAAKPWKPDGAAVATPTEGGTTLDVYAIWKPKSGYYEIRFNKNDGTGAWRSLACEYGKATALPTCANGLGWTRKGYAFAGWATSAANAKAGKVWKADAAKVSTATPEGTTLNAYAIWAKPYSIRLIRNDGAGTMETVELPYGVSTKLPTLSALGWARRGYAFTGWYTSTANITAGKVWKPDGGTVASPTAAGTQMDVYAGWKLKSGYYQIRFNRNDGTGKWRSLAYEYGKATALPTCANGLGWTRRGYVFAGWATSAANATAGKVWKADAEKVSTAIAAGKTLNAYAVWKKASANAMSMNGIVVPSLISRPSSLVPGCCSGIFADGSGTFDLLVEADGSAFFRAETEDGVWTEGCEADLVGNTLVLTFKDAAPLVIICDAGIAIAL